MSSSIKQEAIDKFHGHFPPQRIPFSKKTKVWRVGCVEWAASRTYSYYAPVRSSLRHKRINYDLYNGKLHMKDVKELINPEGITLAQDTPEKIQHFPLLNKNIDLLLGEEKNRVFDWRVVVTNPNALSDIEETKKKEVLQRLQELIESSAESDEDFEAKFNKMADYFTYEYQDMREVRGNEFLRHYSKQYDIPQIFNDGFKDALIVGEELYQCDIIGGEPVLKRLNPENISLFMFGDSNRAEDADMAIIDEYWSPGKIIEAFYDSLTKEDIDYILGGKTRNQGEQDKPQDEFIRAEMVDESMVAGTDEFGMPFYVNPNNLFGTLTSDGAPFDENGNVKVTQVYWKSMRKIKKVKSYDPETGEETFDFYPENYVIDEDKGEEAVNYYVTQAWEGTKIGEDIYVNIRPRPIQYNSLSNPSRCHFGIIGTIYNTNSSKPYTYMDRMKPYNYCYDVVFDRLNKLMANNKGKLVVMDFAKVPAGWTPDQWMFYMQKAGIVVVDSFKEGTIGAAKGKLAGGLNNANSTVDAELSQSVASYMSLLQYYEYLLTEGTGFSKQRLGQVSNRETVGGVERATLQSSHITEWVFALHENLKKRVMEALLETAKISARGNNLKFSYITSDGSRMLANIDGDEFAECDYGLVVDSTSDSQELDQKLEGLAQAALQNQKISLSAVMKLYNSNSMLEKQRIIENDERRLEELQAQQQQQQLQAQQAQYDAQMQMKQAELEQQNVLNERDNETKVLVATISHSASETDTSSNEAQEKLAESARQFNERLALDKQRLEFDKSKAATDARLKEKQINKKPNTSK